MREPLSYGAHFNVAPSHGISRNESMKKFLEWFRENKKTRRLEIIGREHCGKTWFAKKISEMSECVSSHFCRPDEPQSSEPATVIRSIGEQLMRQFPNLVLPRLSTVTLLEDTVSALDHFLRFPLETMPSSSKPVFIVIDCVEDEETQILIQMLIDILPTWIRMVTTSRQENSVGKKEKKKAIYWN
uniref:NACHT domain-containing protein n=1 Tax=Caenorhabditis tropicalis TaxID=1561998 RepID=A0A1I7TF27_9PELO